MSYFKVRTTDVDYYVSNDDVYEKVCEDASIEEDSDEFYDAIEKARTELEKELDFDPEMQNLEFEFYDCEKEDLDELVCDAISSETGWLINGFNYEIIESK